METKVFDTLMAGLGDTLAYAQKVPRQGTRERRVEVTRTFVAETRAKAGLTQAEFAKVTGASLGTVRKWERGERGPSDAAGMLVRIMTRAPELVVEEAGLGNRRKRSRARQQAKDLTVEVSSILRRMSTAIPLNFQPTGNGKAAISGDFVALADEVNPLIKALRGNDIEVTAIHNHMLDDEPRAFFIHFWANDDAVKLAKGLRAALDTVHVAPNG